MPYQRLWAAGVALLIVLQATAAFAGTVYTLDGQVLVGEIKLTADGGLLVVPQSAAPVKVQLSDLLEAQFADASTARVPVRLPAPWVARDVGGMQPPGQSTWSKGAFTLRSAGEEPTGRRDALHLVFQPLFGDGEISARVVDVKGPAGFAGLMLRDSIEADSPFVMLAVGPGGLLLATRGDSRKSAALRRLGRVELPVYLKILRQGNQFSFETSHDGHDWQRIARQQVTLGDTVGIGLVASAGRRGAVAQATIDRVSVSGRQLRRPDNARRIGPRIDPVLPRGVRTVGASVLPGPIIAVDAQSVALGRDGRTIQLNRDQVATVIFSDLDAPLAGRLDDARPGVLLRDGDYFEGDLRQLRDGRITLASVLFGVRTFVVGEQALALVLAPSRPHQSAYVVRAAGGVVLHADALSIGRDLLSVNEPVFGPIALAADSVRGIRATGARVIPLTSLLPPAADSATTTPDLLVPVGAPLEIPLDGGYTRLWARLEVPDQLLSAGPLRCTILADDREVYRSPPLTNLDAPPPVFLDLAGAKTLRLIVENPDGSPGGAMRLNDPVLVRR